MMKKISGFLAPLLTLALLSACSGSPAGDVITGDPATLLPPLVAEANATLPTEQQMMGSFDEPVTAENSEFAAGIPGEKFGQLVTAAFSSKAGMITSAQTTVLIQANDTAAASEVAQLVAAEFDSTQWICVMPERSLVVTAGSYVMLAVGTQNGTGALVEAFNKLSNNTASEPVIFYTGP
ncbi:MAG: hypothetical protein FWG47_06040 [Propionibacteriaceae bacterium]|nr:hypothetical protein [Propionibacteriaceae bacterium]